MSHNNSGLSESNVLIEQLAGRYDVPLSLTRCFVGHSEGETRTNVRKFLKYVKAVIRKTEKKGREK